MQSDRPSATATFVAFLRALGSTDLVTLDKVADPVAQRLMPPHWGRLMQQLSNFPTPLQRTLWWTTLGGFDTMALRTRAIDEALASFPGQQIVILGAGLDGRAWRLERLRDARVFEVDHPATQARKVAGLRGVPPLAREVQFVPVDFERDSLAGALTNAGHRSDVPTFWLWEGVTMYLARPAIQSTLATIAGRSMSTSQLAMTYLEPSARCRLVGWQAGLLGEPFRGLFHTEEIAALLEEAGLALTSDTGAGEWAQQWGRKHPLGLFYLERLALAETR